MIEGLTQNALKRLLRYDHRTGEFFWLVNRGRSAKAGDEAGTLRPDGFISIVIGGRPWMAQRLAWLYVKGELPDGRVFFKDGNRSNTKWLNLTGEDTFLSTSSSALYQRQRRHNRARKIKNGLLEPTGSDARYLHDLYADQIAKERRKQDDLRQRRQERLARYKTEAKDNEGT